MNKKSFQKIYITFIVSVLGIMLSAAVIMASIVLVAIKFDLLMIEDRPITVLLIFITVVSLIIGTLLAALSGKKILSPVSKLIEAIQEVTNGNFGIQLEAEAPGELGDLILSFNRMAKELNNIEIFRNDFIVNVSHEFKTPLVAIQGYATLLQDEDLTVVERREYTQMLLEGTRRLSVLSSNILKLSKLDTQDTMVEKENFSLDEQIREAFLLLETQWSEKDMILHIDLEPVVFFGNEELLMQVWLNLLGNAIKYSHNQGQITVTLRTNDNSHIVVVQDDGIGMSQEVQEHIFDKFYQGDITHSSEGNGLGLALIKRIVDLSGGFVKVSSISDQGSVFTVILPKEKKI